jgi:mannose-1-phosphate guanylyltransferase
MVKQNNYCVIMAGGIGSRFWPMSRTSFPKQFHDILGTGNTLIQMTYKRFRRVCPAENILVVTNEKYRSLVLEQLPDLQSDQVLCEPYMRILHPASHTPILKSNRATRKRVSLWPLPTIW